MRLRRLLIEHYGNFERLDLPLDPAPGRINLVVAPNGAGKSVLRQAFHDLLFGYQPKSKMNYRYGRGLSLQAEALTRDGVALHFGWQHPGGRTFPDPADAAAAARFGAALGAIRPPQLENLFALDTARLRAGGEALAQGGDSLGLALLSGTGELMSAKTARAGLAERRDAVWAGSQKSGRSLAKAARALAEARKTVRDGVQLPVQRDRAVSKLAVEQARLAEARATHAAMQAEAGRLARIDRTRRFLDEHRAALEWLAANPDAPVLDPGLAEALAAARHAVSLTAARQTDAQAGLAQQEAALAALTLDRPALDHAPALEAVRAALGQTEKAAGDIIHVQGERAGHLTTIAAALRALGAAVPLEQADTLLPRLADETAARQSIAQHASRAAAQEAAARRVRQAQEALARLDETAIAPPPPGDALATLLTAIRADRDPVRHLAETAAAARDAAAAEAAARAASPAPCPSAGPAPGLAVFERLDQQRNAAAAALREAAGARDRLADQRGGWERRLAEMRREPLPDQAAIAAKRAQRDAVWRLLHRRVYGAEGPDAAQEQALLGGEAVEQALPRLIHEADALADWRLRELSLVQEAEGLGFELSRTAAEAAELTAAAAAAQQALAAATAAFAAPCAAIGLDAQASLPEMRNALDRAAAARAAAQAFTLAQARHQAVLNEQAGWAEQLRALLPAAGPLPFAALLATADAALRTKAATEAAHIRHAAERSHAAQALAEAQSELAACDQALAAWQTQWAARLAALGRPPGETPAATEAVLQCLSGLASAHAASAGLAGRIDGMAGEVATYAAAVRALAGTLGVPAEADTFVTARRLIARHEAAQRQRTHAESAQAHVMTARAALQTAADAAAGARQELAAIIAACGAVDGDGADRRIAAARERARQEAARDQAASGLRQAGDGLAFAALQAEADSVPAAEAALLRAAAQRALAEARDASEAAASAETTLRQTLDAEAASPGLGDALLQQEGAGASFSRLLEDYLLLAVAEQMLAQSLIEVEAQAGTTGVARIAAAFARVTDNDYGIDGEEGPEGKTILKAVERHWPLERKDLAQLSEGTRDQLYLALRIVAIEDHVLRAAPLPFLADDILQTFDDARAVAALQALLALSQHTQVIVLTHHPHVAALAQALPPGSVHHARLSETVAG